MYLPNPPDDLAGDTSRANKLDAPELRVHNQARTYLSPGWMRDFDHWVTRRGTWDGVYSWTRVVLVRQDVQMEAVTRQA